MQCIIVKSGARCEQDSQSSLGLTLPIIKPDTQVFICTLCIDEMHFIAHQVETPLLPEAALRKEVGLEGDGK